MQDDILTRREAAKVIGVSVSTLDKYRNLGLLRSRRLGMRKVVIYRSDLNQFLESLPDALDRAAS